MPELLEIRREGQGQFEGQIARGQPRQAICQRRCCLDQPLLCRCLGLLLHAQAIGLGPTAGVSCFLLKPYIGESGLAEHFQGGGHISDFIAPINALDLEIDVAFGKTAHGRGDADDRPGDRPTYKEDGDCEQKRGQRARNDDHGHVSRRGGIALRTGREPGLIQPVGGLDHLWIELAEQA